MTYHTTVIVGNLGNDPELRYLPSGTPVCNFSIAVSERWSDRQTGEKREKTTWYRVGVFGAQADACAKYLSKGKQALVVGTVEARAYMNKAGEPAASLELNAREVRFLSSPATRDDSGGYEPQMQSEWDNHQSGGQSNDIPF